MDAAEREELIRRYQEGPRVLREAAAGLSEDRLDHRRAPKEWTPREVVHHTLDSEMTGAIRLRRLIAEESPHLQGYDERLFAERLHYDRPIEPSLAGIAAVREATVTLLRALTEAEWGRSGTHSESGPYSVEGWLRIYAAHCHEHADQIRRAVAG